MICLTAACDLHVTRNLARRRFLLRCFFPNKAVYDLAMGAYDLQWLLLSYSFVDTAAPGLLVAVLVF